MTDTEKIRDAVTREKQSDWKGPAIGVAFSVVWFLLVAACLAWLVGFGGGEEVDRGRAVSIIRDLIWPLTVVGLGIPLIAFIWFGGFSAISRLRELRTHLVKLDDHIRRIDELEKQTKDLNSQLFAYQDLVSKISDEGSKLQEGLSSIELVSTKAAQSISEATTQVDRSVADLKRRIEKLEGAHSPESLSNGDDDLEENYSDFEEVYDLAEKIFYRFLNNYNENPGSGNHRLFVQRGGWGKADISLTLRTKGRMPIAIADALMRFYEIEGQTRRSGRENVDQAELQAIRNKLESI